MTKGGVMLIKTAMPKPGTTVEFTCAFLEIVCLFLADALACSLQYTDRSGKRHEHRFSHVIPPPPPVGTPALYEGTAVRKAILLSRYVNLIRNYLHDAHQHAQTPSINSTAGIPPAPIVSATSTNLTPSQAMSGEYVALTELFEKHFLQEADEIGDKLLAKELALLQELKNKTAPVRPTTNVVA